MKNKVRLLLFVLFVLIVAVLAVLAGESPAAAQISPVPIRGDRLPPNAVVFTIDDAPDEIGPDGENQTLKVARYLATQGIRAVFFVVGCHFDSQPEPDPRSWICRGSSRSQPTTILRELVALGHVVGNHTQDHIPFTLSGKNEVGDNEVRYQVGHLQRLLDRFQPDGLHLFRVPGLLYHERVASALNADPYLERRLTGPLDSDARGHGFLFGEWIGGDWDCYRRGYAAETCGELYIQKILNATAAGHGSVLLMHARTEYMDGRDGSRNFPLALATYLVKRLTGLGYSFVPVDVLPGSAMAQNQPKVLIFPRVAQAAATLVPAGLPGYNYGSYGYKNIDEFQLGIALTNISASDRAMVKLTVYGENGEMISGSGIINPATIDLAPGHQSAQYAYQIFGQGIQKKIGWVEASFTSGDVKGFYFVFNDGFDFLSGAPAIPVGKAAKRIILPLLDSHREQYPIPEFPPMEYQTEVDIVNPGNTPVKVTLDQWFDQGYNTFVNGHSSEIFWERQIPPHGKSQINWIYEPNGGSRYFELLADQPVIASEIILRNSRTARWEGVTDKTLSVCVVTGVGTDESLHKSGLTYLASTPRPHVAIATGWHTSLIHINLVRENIGNQLEYMVHDENGRGLTWAHCGSYPCWPGMAFFPAQKKVTDLQSLFLKPISELNGSLTYGPSAGDIPPERGIMYFEEFGPDMVEFFYDEKGEIRSNEFRTIIPPISKTFSAVFAHVAEGSFGPNQFFGTGIAVRDARFSNEATDKVPNRVALELRSKEGAVLKSVSMDLGPAQKFAKTLPELFSGMAIPQFSGYVRITGTKPFVSLGMYWVVKNGKIVATSMIPQQSNEVPTDDTLPTITLTSPTCQTNQFGWFNCGSVDKNTFSFSGTASDGSGIAAVTWTQNVDNTIVQSGTASGTTSWSVSGIVLQSGDSIVSVEAKDVISAIGSANLLVTYTPSP